MSETAPTLPDETPDLVPAFAGIRDRIIEFRRISAEELYGNPANFREHPANQRAAMLGVLTEYGVNDVLKVYYSRRYGGKLTLINGHLRKDITPTFGWPCVITNYTDEEADAVLLHGDQVTALATINGELLASLMAQTPRPISPAVQQMLDDLLAAHSYDDPPRSTPDDQLADAEYDARQFWPWLRVQVPQETLQAWQAFLDKTHHEPHAALGALLAGAGHDPVTG